MSSSKKLIEEDQLNQLERVGEGEHHGDTDANQEGSVNQTGQQEHLGLQGVHQLRLASRSFNVLAAHEADTDTGTDGTQTNDQAGSQSNKTENVFHDNSLLSLSNEKVKQKTGYYSEIC
jgi:hypothetical protein